MATKKTTKKATVKKVATKTTAARKSAAKGGARKSAMPPSLTTRTVKRGSARKGGAQSARADVESNGSHDGDDSGAASLVIVESPAKARTIRKDLGRGYKGRATAGHIRDLPPEKMGSDIQHVLKPGYVT